MGERRIIDGVEFERLERTSWKAREQKLGEGELYIEGVDGDDVMDFIDSLGLAKPPIIWRRVKPSG